MDEVQFQNKLTLSKDELNQTLTAQLVGEASFIEEMIPTLIQTFGFKQNHEPEIKAYNDVTGYISKELKQAPQVQKNQPEHYRTGIIRQKDGNLYKCRYECPSCGNKKNRYIKPSETSVTCHTCHEKMDVTNVGRDLYDNDSFNNFFVAGLATPSYKDGEH